MSGIEQMALNKVSPVPQSEESVQRQSSPKDEAPDANLVNGLSNSVDPLVGKSGRLSLGRHMGLVGAISRQYSLALM